ncbi:MAG: hypothetical protein IKV98_06295 [Clostridia bacterium]|nr:hypothetical protein [Clostridia bacterium]
MKKDFLLFYFSDEKCDASVSVIPTLAALSDKMGFDFETYICTRPDSWSGKVLPFVGHNHAESFYYLANFYKKILFCSITDYKSFQFKREVLAFGGEVISCRKNDEVPEFYEDVFSYLGAELPKECIVVPKRPDEGKWIAPYCYPDIQHSGKLGIDEVTFKTKAKKLESMGIKGASFLYCNCDADGFDTDVIDTMTESETYKEVTTRILERNIDKAKGIGFADPSGILRWQVAYCRKKIVTVYQDYDWEDFVPTVCEYAKRIGNDIVMGNQVVYNKKMQVIKGCDEVITEFARHNVIMDLIGHNPRIGFSIQTEKKIPIDWLADAPTPWECEYSDDFLKEKIKQGAIPVCFLFYAADLGHLPVITRLLDLMSLDGMRAGIAFPSTWYAYHPELLEQIYIPLEQGGVFPQLEPLISSVGVAVATEASGYISPEFYGRLLEKARKDIATHVGERMIPKGYYPFQDASPYYNVGSAQPQYDVVGKAGFEYYITYKECNTSARIVYKTDTMTVLNQQIHQWFPGAGRPIDIIKQWEKEYVEQKRCGWINLAFDTPFFALSPTYTYDIENEYMRTGWAKCGGLRFLAEAMHYVRRTGGETGKLFMLKPHEMYRYAQLLQESGLM